jgi:hypothetical protein
MRVKIASPSGNQKHAHRLLLGALTFNNDDIWQGNGDSGSVSIRVNTTLGTMGRRDSKVPLRVTQRFRLFVCPIIALPSGTSRQTWPDAIFDESLTASLPFGFP